jgi:hypothetical protein
VTLVAGHRCGPGRGVVNTYDGASERPRGTLTSPLATNRHRRSPACKRAPPDQVLGWVEYPPLCAALS